MEKGSGSYVPSTNNRCRQLTLIYSLLPVNCTKLLSSFAASLVAVIRSQEGNCKDARRVCDGAFPCVEDFIFGSLYEILKYGTEENIHTSVLGGKDLDVGFLEVQAPMG